MSDCGICVWGFFSVIAISFYTSLAFSSRPVSLLAVNTASVFSLIVRMLYPINQPGLCYHNVISEFVTFHIIIIIIIIFINCNWVITRWQWLFYIYTKRRKKVTREFKSGGLHERHVVATWKLGNHLSIRL
jgi:hypothetical protein